MKKLLLCLTGVFLGLSSFAQLSGTYTVYGTTPDYATIQDACTALQTSGQSGPVVFNIRDGIYDEAITLNAVAGNSATSTITFQSESADSTAVIIKSTTSTTFTFTDVNYVHFNNLGIAFVGPTGEAVRFDNGGEGTSFNQSSVYYNSPTGSQAVYAARNNGVNSFQFTNSSLISMSDGIYVVSNNSNIDDFTINNSTITTKGNAITVYADKFARNFTITDSEITSVDSTGYAVSMEGVYGGANGLSIINSRILSDTSYGFYGYTEVNMNNVTIDNSEITSNTDHGFYAEAMNNGLDNWNVTNSKFTAMQHAFYVNTDQTLKNFTFTNDTMIVVPETVNWGFRDALNMEGDLGVENVNITDSYFQTDSAAFYGEAIELSTGSGSLYNLNIINNSVSSYDGIDVYARVNIKDVFVSNNFISTQYRCLEIEPEYGNGSNITIENNELENASDEGIDMFSGALFKNMLITNNSLDCADGIQLEGESIGVDGLTIDNNQITANNGAGVSLLTDAVLENTAITNNFIWADDNAIALDGEGGIRNVHTSGNSVYSVADYGIYLYSDATVKKSTFKNDSVRANDQAIYIYGSGGVQSVKVEENYAYSAVDEAIYIEAGLPIKDIHIKKNFAVGDTLGFRSAIYIESDEADMDSIFVTDNEVYSNHRAIYIEADYGNALNSVISHNTIHAGNYGVYLDGAGSNTEISFNTIYPVNTLNYPGPVGTGIYAYGYDGPSTGVTISENYMENISGYGIEAYYLNDLVFTNNKIMQTGPFTNTFGIYADYIGGENSLIDKNMFLFENAGEGIYVINSAFTEANPMVISNNFITGVQYAVDFGACSYVDVLHNSISSPVTINSVYFLQSSNINVKNNIIKNYNTSGEIYYADLGSSDINIDFNVYHYDTAAANMSSDTYFGTFASPYDFKIGTSYDANSFYDDPMFVNDTTDLHLPCNASSLTAGIPSSVTTDIDGVARNLTTPTIGAHEISPASQADFLADSMLMCNSVNLAANLNGSYLWSTNETTQMITVDSVGTYYLTITDACGNNAIDSTVVHTTYPSADFVWGLNELQGVFNNMSTGGSSYSWDFGDGNTSSDVNPVHNYATTGTYTVLLTATNECGAIDTTSVEVVVNMTDVEKESLESRGVNVYPNPTRGNIIVDFSMLLGEEVTLYLVNTDGRILQTEVVSNETGGYKKQMDLSGLSNGMYFVRIATATESITKRVVKQ